MSVIDDVLDSFRVPFDAKIKLKDYDPAWDGDDDVPKEKRKEQAAAIQAEGLATLTAAQELLYASDSWSLLVIFQALDAAGKDGTIKHVMSGVNPQGVQVHSFKHPSAEELDHNFLWRCMKALPERGRIGIFNRSYYEEVLIVQVHPELVAAQRIPGVDPSDRKFWEHRYDDINNFEKHLARNGTAIVKFFLNVSKDEQRKRFLDRLDEPEKNWKFSAGDIEKRQHWDAYQRAYEEAIRSTAAPHAPWYVVPADRKWYTRLVVAEAIRDALEAIDPKFPELSAEKQRELDVVRRALAKSDVVRAPARS